MIYDHMMLDGLEDAYDKGRSMGTFAEDCSAKYQFSREDQDAFAIASVKRAQAATADGLFAWKSHRLPFPVAVVTSSSIKTKAL
jgi:acetyl-CoA C-acetyltransferase